MVIPLCFGTPGQNLHASLDEYNGFVLVELYQYLIMVIELSGVQFGLKSYA